MSEPSTSLTEHKQQYSAYVDRLTTQVIAALPVSVRDEDLKRARARFRVAFSADAQGELLECTGESIARAIVLSAMSGLYPGGPKPDVWLIPRKNKWKNNAKEANWQLSFRGFIRLARRAGWDLEPVLVFEGEEFRVLEGDAPSIHHVRNLDVAQTWETLRYAYVRILPPAGGRTKIAYLNKEQIVKRRGKAQDQAIWTEWPLEMSLKTICNYAGNREAFPLDDPARYAIDASEQAELGGGSAATIGVGSLGKAAPKALEGGGSGEAIDGAAETAKIVDVFERLPAEGPINVADDLREPPADALTGLSGDQLSDLIRDELKRFKNKADQEDACERHFLTKDRLAVFKLTPELKAAGLASLRAELNGLAAMQSEREPGEE